MTNLKQRLPSPQLPILQHLQSCTMTTPTMTQSSATHTHPLIHTCTFYIICLSILILCPPCSSTSVPPSILYCTTWCLPDTDTLYAAWYAHSLTHKLVACTRSPCTTPQPLCDGKKQMDAPTASKKEETIKQTSISFHYNVVLYHKLRMLTFINKKYFRHKLKKAY